MTQKKQHKVTITVKNKISELPKLVALLEQLKLEWSLSDKFVNHLNLIVEEVFSNIVFYAFPNDGEQNIVLDFSKNEQKVTVQITDKGEHFNLLEYHNVNINLPVDDRPIGGLGIHILKKLTDDLSYERQGNKNVVKLIKNI